MAKATFTMLGPGAGGAMFNPAIDPFDANHMMITCDMSGIYITHDAGKQWQQRNMGSASSFLAFDAGRQGTAYSCSTGLFRTRDGGDKWELIFPSKQDAKHGRGGSEGSWRLLANGQWPGGNTQSAAAFTLPNGQPYLLVTIGRPRHLSGGRPCIELFESRDDGVNFTKIADLPGWHTRLLTILTEPNGVMAYAATEHRILAIDAATGAQTDIDLPEGITAIHHADIALRANGETLLYVMGVTPSLPGFEDEVARPYWADPKAQSEWAGMYVREKGAWRASDYGVHAPVPGLDYARFIAAAPGNADVAYLSVFKYEPFEKRGRYEGIMKTCDAGQTWAWVMASDGNTFPDHVEEGWLDTYYGYEWPEGPIGIACAKGGEQLLYTTLGSTMASFDGGKTIKQLYCRQTPCASSPTGKASANIGLNVTTCYGYHVDPHNPNNAIISYTDIGMSRSEDGGKSWIPAMTGVPRSWINTAYWTVYDPAIPGRVYSAWGNKHDLPLPKMFRRGSYFHSNDGGICISDDGGVNWRPVLGDGHGGVDFADESLNTSWVLLDESSPVSARVLWCAMPGRGVLVSRDSGETWALCNDGLPETSHAAYAHNLALAANGDLYLTTMRALEPSPTQPKTDVETDDPETRWGMASTDIIVPGGFYVLPKGQTAWQRIALPDNENAPTDISLFEGPNGTGAYISFWPAERIDWDAPGDEAIGGAYRYDATGWTRLDCGASYCIRVYADPVVAGRAYVSAFENAVMRTDDYGKTWRRLNGYTFRAPQKVSRDPLNPDMIYVPNFGSSVTHGPADGADCPDTGIFS